MKIAGLGLLAIVMLFPFAKSAHAFIILPAIILIPIAQIVAVIVGGFSLPAMGLGVLWSKFTGKSLSKGILFGISFLIISTILLFIILKFLFPERPFL